MVNDLPLLAAFVAAAGGIAYAVYWRQRAAAEARYAAFLSRKNGVLLHRNLILQAYADAARAAMDDVKASEGLNLLPLPVLLTPVREGPPRRVRA
jgi:cell division protein FtsL